MIVDFVQQFLPLYLTMPVTQAYFIIHIEAERKPNTKLVANNARNFVANLPPQGNKCKLLRTYAGANVLLTRRP